MAEKPQDQGGKNPKTDSGGSGNAFYLPGVMSGCTRRTLDRPVANAKLSLHTFDYGTHSLPRYLTIRPAKSYPPNLPVCIQAGFGWCALDNHAHEGFAAGHGIDLCRYRPFELCGCDWNSCRAWRLLDQKITCMSNWFQGRSVRRNTYYFARAVCSDRDWRHSVSLHLSSITRSAERLCAPVEVRKPASACSCEWEKLGIDTRAEFLSGYCRTLRWFGRSTELGATVRPI